MDMKNNNDVNSLSQHHQTQLQTTQFLKPECHESPRKVVSFNESNLNEQISSTSTTNNMEQNSSQKNIIEDQKSISNHSISDSERAQWLLDNTAYNSYRSKDNRRNSTIIDSRKFVYSKRRASLAIAGSESNSESGHRLSNKFEGQRHIKQSTFESINDDECKKILR